MVGNLISTRDKKAKQISYSDALLAGLAPDGGLYVLVEYPQVSAAELEGLRRLTYPALSFAIKRKFVGGAIPDSVLEKLTEKAYSEDKFHASDGNVTPVRQIGPSLFIQNLSKGPTAAFKDMALQPLAQEINYELGRRRETLVFLGATSGDTGSSAESAFKGLEKVIMFMLSPQEGMTPFQKAQMGILTGGNIFNISIDGRFDDCQDIVKQIKKDPEFASLGAVNSINKGRIASQVPYYFEGYLQVASRTGQEVDFVVPSGNFGNVLAGYIAKKMGLPIRRLIVATNENKVLANLIETGVYRATPSQITTSPSMDISKASNYERLAFDLLGRDPQVLAEYMGQFERTGSVNLANYGASVNDFGREGFYTGSSTHKDRLKSILKVYNETGSVIDPHTADGVSVALKLADRSVPTIVMETALPVKFEDTIKEALGFVPEREARFRGLEERAAKGFVNLPANVELVKEFIRDQT